jgi:uroporphyrinogen decarboxylase
MNARERVMLALNHKEPDRIPIDLGGSICSSIHRDAYIELKKHLGMDLEEIQMVDYIQQLPYLD